MFGPFLIERVTDHSVMRPIWLVACFFVFFFPVKTRPLFLSHEEASTIHLPAAVSPLSPPPAPPRPTVNNSQAWSLERRHRDRCVLLRMFSVWKKKDLQMFVVVCTIGEIKKRETLFFFFFFLLTPPTASPPSLLLWHLPAPRCDKGYS